MACQSISIVGGPQVLWTSGVNGNNLLTHIISSPIESVRLTKARALFEIFGRTGGLTAKLMARYGDNGVSWDSWFRPSGGPSFGATSPFAMTSWCDLLAIEGGGTPTVRRFVQLGLEVSDTSAVIAMAAISWNIDTQGV